jgi:hypothetical protein
MADGRIGNISQLGEYACSQISQYRTTLEGKRGKHSNRPNRAPEAKKDQIQNFISPFPKL